MLKILQVKNQTLVPSFCPIKVLYSARSTTLLSLIDSLKFIFNISVINYVPYHNMTALTATGPPEIFTPFYNVVKS